MCKHCPDDGECFSDYDEIKHLRNLPSVYPKNNAHKHVIYSGDGYADGSIVYDMAECPNCGYEYEESDHDWEMPFCPNCGCSLLWEMEGEINDGKC